MSVDREAIEHVANEIVRAVGAVGFENGTTALTLAVANICHRLGPDDEARDIIVRQIDGGIALLRKEHPRG